MTRRQYLRRIAILCLHCLRNLASYRGGWNKGSPLVLHPQFWVAVNGNFLDVCVLEWCKLFGDPRGKHYWAKGISDGTAFFAGLLKRLGLTESEFSCYIVEMRSYRDKYVAHLDSDEKFNIPKLGIARDSVIYLYSYLLEREDQDAYFSDGPRDASQFYEAALEEAQAVYRKQAAT